METRTHAIGVRDRDDLASTFPAGKCRREMIGVAHEDDDLLFINPQIQLLVTQKCPISVVYLTTGDAGHSFVRNLYAKSREAGVVASYARMANVGEGAWKTAIEANGHAVTSYTLRGRPNIRLTFFRLPDGFPTGVGSATYLHESLLKLFRGEISSIATVDSGQRYTEASLIETISILAQRWKVQRIRTLDFDNSRFGHAYTSGADHSDHGITGRYFQQAGFSLNLRGNIIAYRGYPIAALPRNLTPEQSASKKKTFEAYLEDVHCIPLDCRATHAMNGKYLNYIDRQYPRTQKSARPGEIVSLIGDAAKTGSTELCLNADTHPAKNGTDLVRTAHCAGTPGQSWKWQAAGALYSQADNQCLTAAPSLHVEPCHVKNPAQKWRRDRDGHLASNGLCLTQDDDARRKPRLHLGVCTPTKPENTWLW
ncbi:ricin-type beta-trefoil lectin domain protein [Streptomyces aureus]|uniref:Ricin-type beta-trefoil lectin domain protein n=1 Tax=Streptomyces aureus TaxID=193461 RepID=A0ABV4SX78_9ACTN